MEIILISILILFATGISTMTGFGTSTLMVPVLVLFYPHPEVLLFVGIIHLFGNIWKIILFRGGVRWKIVLLFGIPGFIMSYLGARLTSSLDPTLLVRILGIFLLLYVVFLWFRKDWKIKKSDTNAAAGGAMSGFAAGVFGIGGAIRSTYLSMYDLPKEVYLFTNGAIGIIIDLARLNTYHFSGIRVRDNLYTGMLVFIPVSLISALIARKIVRKIPQNRFRLFLSICIAVIALKFIFIP